MTSLAHNHKTTIIPGGEWSEVQTTYTIQYSLHSTFTTLDSLQVEINSNLYAIP